MTAWWDGRLCGFDCESTGLDVESARIVTAAVLARGGPAPETLTLMADPGIEIPEEATAVHGISTATAQAYGAPPRDVLEAIRATLATSIEAGWPLVVFNARFDLTLLDRELRRHGFDPLPFARVVDPMVIDRHRDRFRRGSRKLVALCAHYGVTLDDAHDATADALAACRLAYRLGQRGGVVRRVRDAQEAREKMRLVAEWERCQEDVTVLHECEVRWAREQALGLREHFALTGTADPESVALDWPMVPYSPGQECPQ
jgi:DNA polymerase-3 subunit epsilon